MTQANDVSAAACADLVGTEVPLLLLTIIAVVWLAKSALFKHNQAKQRQD